MNTRPGARTGDLHLAAAGVSELQEALPRQGNGTEVRSGGSRPGDVAGVLLAAGAGRRLGAPKALISFAGSRLADRGLVTLRKGGCRPVLVVLGAAAEEVRRACALEVPAESSPAASTPAESHRAASTPAESHRAAITPAARTPAGRTVVVVNRGWEEGMGSSVRAGLAEARRLGAPAALVLPVDQPLVTPALVARLIERWREGATAAVATYGGEMSSPALLDRSLWPEVERHAVGDVGARGFLRSHPEVVTPVACDDVGDPADIDTEDDLRRLEAALSLLEE